MLDCLSEDICHFEPGVLCASEFGYEGSVGGRGAQRCLAARVKTANGDGSGQAGTRV
ncbi:hypothetical protein GCM10029976_032360 [Kribbella albertanoniae]